MRGIKDSWVWLLFIFTAATLVDAGFFGQMISFTPLHLEALGLNEGEVTYYTGLLASLTWAVGIPFLPLWGALADRYSRQPVIARSFLAFLVAGALMFVARDLWLFALGRAMMTFALGNSGLMMTTLSERVPKHRMGLAFGIMNSAAPIGFFAGPLAGGPVVDAWGLRTLIAINMALIALVMVGLVFGYKDTYQGNNTGPIWRMAADSVVLIARSPALRTLFFAIFVLFLGWEALLPYIPLAVEGVYRGADIGTAVGYVTGLGGLIAVVVGPLMGSLADRHGRWRVLFIGAALGAALLPLPMFVRTMAWLIVTWGAANGVLSAIFALSFTVLSESTSTDIRGRVMSFAYLPSNIAAAAGPALASAIAAQSVWWLFPLAAIMTVIGMGVMALARRAQQSDEQPVAVEAAA
jgi:MFS transporter, DHA1 family, multidrug resistance protein